MPLIVDRDEELVTQHRQGRTLRTVKWRSMISRHSSTACTLFRLPTSKTMMMAFAPSRYCFACFPFDWEGDVAMGTC